MKALSLFGFLFVLMWGCSQGQGPTGMPVGQEGLVQNPNQNAIPGVLSVQISPQDPTSADTLMAQVQDQTGGHMANHLRYQWLRDGSPISGAASSALASSNFNKGESISVQISDPKMNDPKATMVSEAVRILNSPPQILSISFNPSDPRSNQPIEVTVQGSDQDQDPLDYTFRWYKNDQEVEGEMSGSLVTEYFHKGDHVHVVITAHDGEEEGEPFLSPAMPVLNSPPNITSNPPFSINEDGEYRYHIQAVDPDGDDISFEVAQGPSGMGVNSQNGLLSWRPTPDDIGVHSIEIAAVDPDGSRGIQQYDLQIFSREGASN